MSAKKAGRGADRLLIGLPMSKAFTKESEGDDEFEGGAQAALPDDFKNFITPAGLKRLRDELDKLWRVERPKLTRVLNATGVVIHTNLGRSPVSDETAAAIARRLPVGTKGWRILPVVGRREHPLSVLAEALQASDLARPAPRGGILRSTAIVPSLSRRCPRRTGVFWPMRSVSSVLSGRTAGFATCSGIAI